VLYGDNAPFYDRQEIRQMRSYLRIIEILSSPNESGSALHGALDQIINIPARGIGPASQRMIRGDQAEIGWDQLIEAMVDSKLRQQVREAVKSLFDLLNRLAKKADVITPEEMIRAVIRETGWEQWLDSELEGHKELQNLRELAIEAQQYHDLAGFLHAIHHKARSSISGDGVTISTIHSAKGLEWPVVFVIGMNEGTLPHIKAIEMEKDPSEERRLAHVAFTRARNILFLSWFRERTTENGRTVQLKPSRFLAMLPKENLSDYHPNNLGSGIFEGGLPAFYPSEEEKIASFIGG
jgi:DNA helicase-2/ATP-dependent DNA helicase PcrA